MILSIVKDEAALNLALTATYETKGNEIYIRIRPNAPQTYYPFQGSSIILTFNALDALVSLAERNGWIKK